jgi:AAA domain
MNSTEKTTRIVFIGAPGCGKSTLAADVFVAFKKLGKNVELVMEWIRRDIMKNGSMTNVFEQYRTLMNNRHEEEHFPEQVEYIVQDGGTLLGYFYAAVYSTKIDQRERLVIQDMYEALLNDLYSRKYDHIYFLPRTAVQAIGANIKDGTRFQTDHQIEVLENYMRLIFTEIHRMDNIKVLECPLGERVETIMSDILM